MPDTKIEPALTPEEWAKLGIDRPSDEAASLYILNGELHASYYPSIGESSRLEPAPTMAFANAALPDSDPRKLTREHVRALREEWESEWDGVSRPNAGDTLLAIAAIIDSLLPPKDTR